jgi:hypothetical protein
MAAAASITPGIAQIWAQLPVAASEALAEGQLTGLLDNAQEIAALTATVPVKEIFAAVDIERRAGARMQRTESD